MKNLFTIIALCIVSFVFSQTKNFIDQPYLETSAKADTLVIPDRIYLDILISEKDTKDKKSIEELEILMEEKLKSIGIDTKKQLTLNDLASNFKKYFLKNTDILKTKSYSLIVYDAKTAGRVIYELENSEISNVKLIKTEHSKAEEIILDLKAKAVIKAKNKAILITKALNQKLGTAIFISDLENNIYNSNSGDVEGIVVMGYSAREKKELKPIDIEFKKIKFETNITVKFKLE